MASTIRIAPHDHLVAVLRAHAARQPDALLYRFLEAGDPDGPQRRWSFGHVDLLARGVGAMLQEAHAAGERALLLFPPGLEFIAAFLGCLYSGTVAVPAYPPDPARLDRTLSRLRAIAADSGARYVITTSALLALSQALRPRAPELGALTWLASDVAIEARADGWTPPELGPDTLAFLQYTSGSTGDPRGVMLSHAQLLHNQELIKCAFGNDADTEVVGWLPLFHDMGLIGNVLQPLYLGRPCTLMSPAAFLQRPLRWLEAVSRYRATTSGGPNFAYDLCARKASPEAVAALDLGSWQVAFNGAEPIRAETMRRFARTFAPCGFRPEAFYPCYGLAEATLFVTGARRGRGAAERTFDAGALAGGRAIPPADAAGGAQVLVSSGESHDPGGQRLVIVQPETHRPGGPGEVGEIWIASPSVARGYWNRVADSEHTFGARLAEGEGPFLRTGDLGFVFDGELFVTGRLKDLIIIRGRNLYPQDLELTCEQAHPAIRPGRCAAFSIEVDHEERLVVAAEAELVDGADRAPPIVDAIRRAIAEAHAVQAHAIVLLEPRSIPRTSSGKLQRRACREAFLHGALATITTPIAPPAAPPSGPIPFDRGHAAGLGRAERRAYVRSYLRGQAAQRLRLDPSLLDPHAPLIQHGLDSLSAMELRGVLEAELGLEVPIEELLGELSLAALADRFVADAPGAATIPRQSDRSEAPLSAEQQRLWLLDLMRPGNPAYNIPLVYRLTGALDVRALTHAAREVVRRHEVLRARIVTRREQPFQSIQPYRPLPVAVTDLSDLAPGERALEARRLALEEASRPFDLTRDLLLRIGLLRLADDAHWLLVTAHHIACDLWSTTLLIDELVGGYQASRSGSPRVLPELPIQYADFAAWQAGRPPRERDLAYWRQHLAHARPLSLAIDRPRSRAAPPSAHGDPHAFRLAASIDLLRSFSRASGVTPFMVLLTAFQIVLHRCTGQDDLVIGSPVSGRTRPELERLIGFFAYPLVLRTSLAGNPTFREALARVREVALEAYAHQEVPFARIVEAARADRAGRAPPLVQILFGYLDRPIASREAGGLRFEPLNLGRASSDLELFLTLFPGDGGLQGTLEYAAEHFTAETIAQLAAAFDQVLAAALAAPETRLADLPLPSALARTTAPAPRDPGAPAIAISATFTAEPVQDALAYWMAELGLPLQIAFAPYNQVFQQLLDEASTLSRNTDGVNVLLLRLEDWLPRAPDGAPATGEAHRLTPAPRAELERNVAELVRCLKHATRRSPTPYLLALCPPSPARLADPAWIAASRDLERELAREVDALRGVHLLSADELAAAYPVADHAAIGGDELGHIPFTPLFFTALGTWLARKVAALRRTPYKVIVLDCDDTLWSGVCGEDGPQGVKLERARLELQRFLVRQHDAGMLLCLCSKNNEADVREVFAQRTEMPLRLHHLVAHRINWDPKSANLRSLAAELRLGLDSFVFIDDDHVMCAEVRQHCPGVLVLQLPSAPDDLAAFPQHLWALDRLEVTAEDRRRTALYRQDLERQQVREATPDLASFIANLELQVSISAPREDDFARLAQLTQRTNQLNTSVIRRREGELRQLCQGGELEVRCVRVSDRFGDYGLAGAMLFSTTAGHLVVDTLLLSCRALGRGVEARMLAALGTIARQRGLGRVTIAYRESAQNQPALDLLDGAGAIARSPTPDGMAFELSADALAAGAPSRSPTPSPPPGPDLPPPADLDPARLPQAERLRRVASDRWTPQQILEAIRARRARGRPELATAFVAPRTPIERTLGEIWRELLGVAPIGVADDFFALGGHSLLAAQLVSRVRERLHLELPLTALFDNTTIGALARVLEDLQIEQADAEALAEAEREIDGLSDEEVRALLALEDEA